MKRVIGIVSDIKESHSCYTVVILKQNYPFRTVYRTFHVANYEMEDINKGDEIAGLTFQNEDRWYHLTNMEHISIDLCPDSKCYCYLEAECAQRDECPECWNIPEDETRKRVELYVKFHASFSFGNSVQLHFYNDNTVYYSMRINENNPLYQKVNFLIPGRSYFITAWKVYTSWEGNDCWDSIPEEIDFWVKTVGLDILEIE